MLTIREGGGGKNRDNYVYVILERPFTTLDVKSGYCQVSSNLEFRKHIALASPNRGICRFQKMACCFINAPNTFRRLSCLKLYLKDSLIFFA